MLPRILVEYLTKQMNFPTITSILLTITALIFTRILYEYFLKPFLRVLAYKDIPNSIITYKIGDREVWTKTNISAPPLTTKRDSPFLATEEYNLLREHPDLQVIVSNLIQTPMITLIDHQLGAEIAKNHDNYMHFRSNTLIGKTYLRYSMIFSTGLEWKRQRKLISKSFDFESMQKVIPIVQDVAKEFFAKGNFANGKDPIPLQQTFVKTSWEAFSRSFFGDNLKGYTVEGVPFAQSLNVLLKEQSEMLMDSQYQIFGTYAAIWNSDIRRQVKKLREFGKVAEKIIEDLTTRIKRGETKVSDDRKGILELIIESSEEHGDKLTNLELIANFISFSFAGTDTTANTSSNLLYCLATHPEVKRKLIEEINANWDGESPMTLAIINKLEYFHALILETLRVMSPAPFLLPRVAKSDHMIGNIPIKKGYLVQPQFGPTWLSPKFIKDPEVFKPERWIKGHEEQEHLRDVYTFNPFSFGARTCIGQHFAAIQIKIMLSYFLTRFDFELPPNFKLSPMITRATMEPQEPIQMLIWLKKNAN